MLRSFLSAAAIFVLLFSGFFIPTSVSARSRCPVKEPETLLSLYQNSDSIYIATFDKTVDGEITESTADYTSIKINKHFSISSTLKGESRKFVVIEDTDYRYKNITETPEVTEMEGESEDPEASVALKPGDTLLLFLRDGEEEDDDEEASPQLTDYRDGTKKLSMEEIGVYEARIKELSDIFSAKKVDEASIVAWLVRCAEDRVTRWEGTFELLQSFQSMEWREQAAEERKTRIARGEPVEEEAVETETPNEEAVETETANEEGEEEEEVRKNVDTSVFAKLLDANQKQTLANLLLDRPAPAADDKDTKIKHIAGDAELLELVKRWGDSRLVGFLLDRLRANSSEPYIASQTMTTISEILDDEKIKEIADKYNQIAYEAEEETITESDEANKAEVNREDQKEVGTETTDNPEGAKTPAVVEVGTPAVDPNDGKEAPKKITYKELRNEMLQKFLQRCDTVIAAAEKKSEEDEAP
jgi:hypothetical protein